MIKPPADLEEKKSRKERSASSPWLNCAGFTMLVLSLVLSVAALWIPWQRFDLLEKDIRQMEERYETLQELINNTWLDIHYQASLMNSPDLVKSLDPSNSYKPDQRLKSTLKKINKNEKDIQKFSASYRQLEEKLQKQIENVKKERDMRDQDKIKTREILDEIRNVSETTNNLRLAVEKIQSGVAGTRERQEENVNNITRLAANMENFSLRLSNQLTEEKIQAMIEKHESSTLQSDETELESQTSLEIETELQSLREAVSQLSSHVNHQMEDCSAKIAEEVETVNEANSGFQADLQGLDERLEELTSSMTRLSEAKEVSETLADLESRVKDQNNQLNLFIQNVVTYKKLPQMIEDLKKRLELIEN